ncbi:MAG: hypothetical protein KC731_02135 [Myxococcales bacterium]|nr:hypothetical protein [Myxococcales bacterium]
MGALLGFLGLATARVAWSGEAEIAASTAALDAGDPREAIVRARRAAGWYLPGAPHVRVAYERLIALARGAEEHKRDDLALLAWRGVRSASIESRWLLTPHAQDRALAEKEIARLEAKRPEQLEPDAAALSEMLATLRGYDPVRPLWSGMMVLGCWLAAAGLVATARRAAGPAGQLDLAKARLPLATATFGVLVWLLGLWRG